LLVEIEVNANRLEMRIPGFFTGRFRWCFCMGGKIRSRASARADAGEARHRLHGQRAHAKGCWYARGDRGRQSCALYLPAYLPDLNPTENVYAKLKPNLRKWEARTVAAIWKLVGRSLKAIAPCECAGYVRHAGYRA